jgi:hypothetical protein
MCVCVCVKEGCVCGSRHRFDHQCDETNTTVTEFRKAQHSSKAYITLWKRRITPRRYHQNKGHYWGARSGGRHQGDTGKKLTTEMVPSPKPCSVACASWWRGAGAGVSHAIAAAHVCVCVCVCVYGCLWCGRVRVQQAHGWRLACLALAAAVCLDLAAAQVQPLYPPVTRPNASQVVPTCDANVPSAEDRRVCARAPWPHCVFFWACAVACRCART